MSKQTEFISRIKEGAIQGWLNHRVLPSLTMAQGILESGWGGSSLATKGNNLFGIKAGSDWKGDTIVLPTKEYINSKWITVDATWRKYDSQSDSVADHALFFVQGWRKTNYAKVVNQKDYKVACKEVKAAGYATDPNYTSLLVNIIESNKLYEIDEEAFKRAGDSTKKTTDSSTASSSSYVVKSGDTLSAIASKYKTTVAKIKSLNGLKSDLIHPGDSLKVSGSVSTSSIHIVVKGDTLSGIAAKYGSTVSVIKSLNGLKSDLIHPGDKLRVTGAASNAKEYYTVKSGDTLSEIAVKYETTVAKIKSLNGLKKDTIYPKQKLQVK
jgi:lysozyme